MKMPGVGPYRFLSELGKGAFGKVYLARDERQHGAGSLVAVKDISTVGKKKAKVERALIRELSALKKVKGCPHVLTYRQSIRTPGHIYLVTEYVKGVTLDVFIDNVERGIYDLGDEALLDIIIQLAEALTCIHARGHAHRDLKDTNILINPETSPPQVTVIDFGLSCLMDLPASATKVEKAQWCKRLKGGNRRYYPKEAFTKERFPEDYPFASLDVFALGLLFLRLATGKVVKATEVPKPVDTGTALLNDIIEFTMIQEDPDLRVSMEEVLEDLHEIKNPRFRILEE